MTAERQWTWRGIVDLMASVAMIVAAGLLIWTTMRAPAAPAAAAGRPAIPIPADPISLAGAPRLGRSDAPVTIVEFSDFECPFCARFTAETLPALQAAYIDTGRAQIIFRHLPLTNIHPRAFRAAEAGECAARQGRFRELHDLLFANGRALGEPELVGYARTAGMDEAVFTACMAGEAAERVREDEALARSLQIAGTPAFLVGRTRGDAVLVTAVVGGAQPLSEFERAIQGAVK